MRKKTMKGLVKDLDQVFSWYIRARDADEIGMCTCCTCNHRAPWKEMDNGHGITRGDRSTRWDERNTMAQCKRCNMRGGEQVKFSIECDKRWGEGTWEELEQKRRLIWKQPRSWYEDQIKLYKEKFKDLQDEKML